MIFFWYLNNSVYFHTISLDEQYRRDNTALRGIGIWYRYIRWVFILKDILGSIAQDLPDPSDYVLSVIKSISFFFTRRCGWIELNADEKSIKSIVQWVLALSKWLLSIDVVWKDDERAPSTLPFGWLANFKDGQGEGIFVYLDVSKLLFHNRCQRYRPWSLTFVTFSFLGTGIILKFSDCRASRKLIYKDRWNI